MADPHVIETLDLHDTRTVLAYRIGLSIALVGLLWTAMAVANDRAVGPTWWVMSVGTSMSVLTLHLYDKRLRIAIGALVIVGWAVLSGAPLLPAFYAKWASLLGIGLHLAGLSALVLKEWFCFRIPLVQSTPVWLAAAIIARAARLDTVTAIALVIGALGVGAVTLAKWRMPLTHDLGDRSKYQV